MTQAATESSSPQPAGTPSPAGPGMYWTRHTQGDGAWRSRAQPPGEDLAALRRGIGREAGTVVQMWPFYTALTGDGRLSAALQAEHLALTLFAVHQQSQSRPMHRTGVGLGTTARILRDSDKFSAEAVDRRFNATATASSLTEVATHLRCLITQLRSIDQPLDYSRLCTDLRQWSTADGRARVRRHWGAGYFAFRATDTDRSPESTS